MRKHIVAGNWKMNNDLPQTEALISDLKHHTQTSNAEVMIAPSFTNLWHAFEALREHSIEVIAQDMHYAAQGAFTGEVSAAMLKSIGIRTVILGHSERRTYFNETDELLARKVDHALSQNMRIIFCFGEELNDRRTGQHEDVVKSQIDNALFHLEGSSFEQIILAYEPVWAIGTGETASPEQAQHMHAYVRQVLANKYDDSVANSVSILYGGSVKPSNAQELFSNPDVDGGLIGGAALNAQDFYTIINSF